MRPALLRRAAAPKAARASCQICKPFSRFSAGKASLLGRAPCPTSVSRPSPVASRCAAAHAAVTSPCALPHCVSRASRSGLAACENAGRVVAPHHGAPSCLRRVPTSQIALLILRRQRLPARPAAPPHVLCALSPAASRRLVAHYVMISPRALPHRVARASRCGSESRWKPFPA